MEKTTKVFVYGTLRQHESNSHLLQEAKCFAKQAWTKGRLYDTGFGFPAVANTHTSKRVYGEVYDVTAHQLERLDQLEGYNGSEASNHYERIVQTVHTDFGSVEAYVYVYLPHQVADLETISFGDWKCHRFFQEEKLYYFAYGSCMDDERFQLAGVKNKFTNVVGCGIADNYTLAYTRQAADGGRADMVEANRGTTVEGKVYEIDQEALTYLFRREGVNANIYRPAFIEITIDGHLHKNALTFLVIDKEEEVAPPVHYAAEILRGAAGFVSDHYYHKLQVDLLTKFKMKMREGVNC
ncbi:MAG: gamma-glutamylcyclotransferase [Bacillus sp. (in: Bacteria)]|nr:gamma-glutamylcyclotransferase [Bacillus sp. (in: firmicutes)]